MQTWHRAILSLAVILGVIALLPGAIYLIGLAKVNSRPVPADPADYTAESIAEAWTGCQESMPLAVEAMSPWNFAGKFLFGDPLEVGPGERAAWRIASAHNVARPVGGGLWWHTSGASLGIWITQHWSAEQIGATLARDNLCK
ncbi:hypothetical protein [Marilutibacter aestuarii]|uniref:Uncharacterized protein n=1 Tax=Marilutibacter aestuarii TaxID=1706195 RepID=A0A507ZQI3_9GAMM|nr:hypothetical protein [Lysobacter aestuarii]TQD39197.1 hypothetical protein FKV25_15680 [Lysobacter aestuarii]